MNTCRQAHAQDTACREQTGRIKLQHAHRLTKTARCLPLKGQAATWLRRRKPQEEGSCRLDVLVHVLVSSCINLRVEGGRQRDRHQTSESCTPYPQIATSVCIAALQNGSRHRRKAHISSANITLWHWRRRRRSKRRRRMKRRSDLRHDEVRGA